LPGSAIERILRAREFNPERTRQPIQRSDRFMSNATAELLKSHRTVRQYTDQPLPEGLLEELIACGQQASTSSNLQAYSIIHVADPKKKSQIAELCADQEQIHQSAVFLAFCADLHRNRLAFDQHKGERFDDAFVEALLIAAVDAALVMQNVAVAAESHGLGICMIGAIRNQPIEVGALLELPHHVFAVSGFCLGYPDPAHPTAVKPRLPQKAVFHRDRYMNDDAMHTHMAAYDQAMAAFYAEQGMHDRDPRWTHVISGRVGRFHQRADLDVFLRDQGYNWQAHE
jgi:nitroreductase